MNKPIFKWLNIDDLAAYMQLCHDVATLLKDSGTEVFMDFLKEKQCQEAIEQRRVASLWIDNNLASTIIVEHCALSERIGSRFFGPGIAELDEDGVYLRNGMVSPQFQGVGLYNILMSQVVAMYAEYAIAGTINVLNLAPQRACASAGLMQMGKLTRAKDGVSTYLYYRPAVAEEVAQVLVV